MDRLTSLHLFIRVMEAGSFSRAARDVNLAQPTVTKHIAELERSLNARLFNRTTRNVAPTEAGLLYYEKCRAALHELDEAASLVRGDTAALTGALRIGTSIAFGRRVLTPLLIEFMQLHPNMRIDLACHDSYVDIVSHGIDAAVRLGKLADSSYGARTLGSSPWAMVASPAYLVLRGEPAVPDDLASHDCLVYSTVHGSDGWQLIQQGGNPVTVPLTGRFRSNNLSSLLGAALSGLGIAALPVYIAGDALESGTLRAVLPEYSLVPQEIHVVFPSPKMLPRKVSALTQFLQDKFQGQWWRR